MQIQGPAQAHGPQAINPPHASKPPQPTEGGPTATQGDQLDISPEGQFIDRIGELPEIRQDRVDAIRTAIAEGTYDTGDKLDRALENLLDEIG